MKVWWKSSVSVHRLHENKNALSAHRGGLERPGVGIHINSFDDGAASVNSNAIALKSVPKNWQCYHSDSQRSPAQEHRDGGEIRVHHFPGRG